MKQKILIVDDDRLVADTLSLVYRANGFDAEARYSAAAGLERARTFGPALVVCDVMMPETNGLQLAEQMQLELPACKVLMLSGYAGNAERVELQAIRLKYPLKLLPKPVSPEELLRESRALLLSA